MKIDEILSVVKGKLLNPEENFLKKEISSFCIDSRKISQNSLFIPIKGQNFDGHSFIEEALKKGATGYLSSQEKNLKNGILVKDTYKALVELAKFKRKQFRTVIGITGTSGKTTTKELLRHVLSSLTSVSATRGNFNNEIGLPLTILNSPKTDIAILEMGAGKVGDINYLSDIASPDIGILVSVGYGHTQKFGSFENVIKGKGEIFNVPEKVVLPENLKKYYIDILKNKDIITFGENGDIKIYDIHLSEYGTEGKISFKKEKIYLKLPFYNKAAFLNIGAVCGTLYHLGYNPTKYLKGLENFSLPQGRGNIIKNGNLTIIDETYNANPLSVKNSIKTLSSLPGLKVLILGDMLELGEYSEKLHREIGKIIKNSNIDFPIFFGKEMKKAYEEAKKGFFFENKKEIANFTKKIIKKEKAFILVKGSRGMKMEEVINFLI